MSAYDVLGTIAIVGGIMGGFVWMTALICRSNERIKRGEYHGWPEDEK